MARQSSLLQLPPPALYKADDFQYDATSDFIGSGSFGIVYRCRLKDRYSDKQVALKIISAPKRLSTSEEASLLNEVSILLRLKECPHIIKLLGVCMDYGHYSIVMEYVDNGNLEDMLLSDSKHDEIKKWSCRLTMSLEIAKGMDFLHNLDPAILHRDLKTANVLVDRNYSCKIIDFGLSTMRGISRRSAIIQSNSSSKRWGTVAFTAPEVFANKINKEQERKMDVYSFSIILWQMKERKPLYDGVEIDVIRANVISKDRPALSEDDCCPGFRHLIIRCWDDQPDVRLEFAEFRPTHCAFRRVRYASYILARHIFVHTCGTFIE
ncbi:dual specificity protein kinase shkC-like [Corticium candelabrum]|uniref:dual specificity protein kinase shkC-like n=1 Tax=Corticium candelabrum TaxID=121492 RepID=UPI002E34BA49|nr:dual specificity protein kinase shkC-like [Corticium candelabrum]